MLSRPSISFCKKKSFFNFLLFGVCLHTYAQTFQHAKRMGCDKAEDRGAAIAVDRRGNQYSTGVFRSFNGIGAQAADFDPGPAFYPMWSNQGGYAAYVSKLNLSGNFVWAKQFTGGEGFGRSITIDQEGNVYVTGRFAGTVDFDPDLGVFNLTAMPGDYDIFIVKLSSLGGLLWAKAIGGTGYDNSNGIHIDPKGNVFVAGDFAGAVDFDPGPDSLFLTELGGYGSFALKLDNMGNFEWARNMGGQGLGNLNLDTAGNCFFSAGFEGTSDLDPDSIGVFFQTSRGASDIFITKLDTAGHFIWSKVMGSPWYDFPGKLELDKTGNIYLVGSFQGDSLFDAQTGNLLFTNSSKNKTNEAFIAKLSQEGSFQWAYALGDTTDNDGLAVALTYDGYVYFSGTFRDSLDFDPGPGKHFLTSKGDPDGFILKLDSAGMFQRVLPISGKKYVVPASLFIDSLQNLYATGWYSSYFSEAIDFDPGLGQFPISGSGNDDIFVLKLTPCQTSDTLSPTSCKSYTLNGVDYTQSGTYVQNFSTPNGCDSSLILKLKILQPAQSNPNHQLCPGQTVQVGPHIYNSSGIFTDTLISANGCDSIITSTLNFSIPNDTLQVNGSGLTAAAGQDSYQWLNCNAGFLPISGETQQTFSPGISGNYAVKVTKGNCTDTSNCVLFTSAQSLTKNQIYIYPQPVKDKLFIHWIGLAGFAEIRLFDAIGRVAASQQIRNWNSITTSELVPGFYQLWVQRKNDVQVFRVVVER